MPQKEKITSKQTTQPSGRHVHFPSLSEADRKEMLNYVDLCLEQSVEAYGDTKNICDSLQEKLKTYSQGKLDGVALGLWLAVSLHRLDRVVKKTLDPLSTNINLLRRDILAQESELATPAKG